MTMKPKKRIMFVCHGNICRSPMAEFIMKNLAADRGCTHDLYIESSATSSEETGNGVYPPAAQVLARHGIACNGKQARRFRTDDYNRFDMVLVMEDYNLRNLARITGGDKDGKVWKLLDFVNTPPRQCLGEDISDPWYHRDFDRTYKEILAGCEALMRYLGY